LRPNPMVTERLCLCGNRSGLVTAKLMFTVFSIHPARRRWLVFIAGIVWSALPAYGQYDSDWASHLRIGAIVGLNIKANFQMSGNLNVNHAAGVYDDGYVHPPPAGSGDDFTSNWGYTSGTQVSGQQLLMHRTTSFSIASGGTSTEENAGALPGFEIAYGGNFWYWGRVRIGWDSGIGFLPIYNLSATQTANGNANQSTFSFDTGPNTSILLGSGLLAPGYQGTPGPGPAIHSTPTLVGTTNLSGATFSGTQTLDVMLYTFRIGPSAYWDFGPRFGMSVSAGPALGVMSGKLNFNETIMTDVTTHTSGHVNGTDVVYGGYVNAMLMYHVVPNGDFYIGAQYMPLGTATISGSGHEAQLKMGGAVYVSAGINWPF
jgi:hypothetical protein